MHNAFDNAIQLLTLQTKCSERVFLCFHARNTVKVLPSQNRFYLCMFHPEGDGSYPFPLVRFVFHPKRMVRTPSPCQLRRSPSA